VWCGSWRSSRCTARCLYCSSRTRWRGPWRRPHILCATLSCTIRWWKRRKRSRPRRQRHKVYLYIKKKRVVGWPQRVFHLQLYGDFKCFKNFFRIKSERLWGDSEVKGHWCARYIRRCAWSFGVQRGAFATLRPPFQKFFLDFFKKIS